MMYHIGQLSPSNIFYTFYEPRNCMSNYMDQINSMICLWGFLFCSESLDEPKHCRVRVKNEIPKNSLGKFDKANSQDLSH